MTDEGRETAWRWDRDGDGVWTLWFEQPGRDLNILDRPALDELDERLAEVEEDSSVQGVLIRSAKPAGFCGGTDLRLIHDAPSGAEVEALMRRGTEVLDRLMRLGPATTAVLHGACLGGGLELALACRHRVALATSVPLQLGLPQVRLGLIPGWGAIEHLPRLLAPKDALELLLFGVPIGFLQARSQGVVSRLISAEEPERLVETLSAEAPAERPFTVDAWAEELDFARAKLDRHSIDFPEAPAAILEVIEIDLARGPEAAREAAIARYVGLARDEAVREALEDFLARPSA
ncbi:enoyl-CoA hydratase-related protein [Planctomyces sp. SH-PL62]|uniref:enoyl-CoA hydratase-related protein n=1 Tax=Planctomyces sp. SH-PL62 TaxID=1636152 RepID=UPI00078BFEB1|nr:enoyl-CoA hydratase-related protein [Planctomyces sp. SH-PL62]AMV38081.1 Fatty acid oxidation complex subunit alpha [Planctomyces sp. SH-PL62]